MEYAMGDIPESWGGVLGSAASPEALASIEARIAEKSAGRTILPAAELVFAALEATPFESVQAVILGQDPYPEARYAMGLAFSVPNEVRALPRSLQNIRLELAADCRLPLPAGGSLQPWARHGVLLLNTVLTVAEGESGSHRGCGWETFTKAVVDAVARVDRPVVFLLWGKQAQAIAKPALVGKSQQVVLPAAHPSPLARKAFRGSKPFSHANDALANLHLDPIDWRLV
jgi:uracil-DNA glycosylase